MKCLVEKFEDSDRELIFKRSSEDRDESQIAATSTNVFTAHASS